MSSWLTGEVVQQNIFRCLYCRCCHQFIPIELVDHVDSGGANVISFAVGCRIAASPALWWSLPGRSTEWWLSRGEPPLHLQSFLDSQQLSYCGAQHGVLSDGPKKENTSASVKYRLYFFFSWFKPLHQKTGRQNLDCEQVCMFYKRTPWELLSYTVRVCLDTYWRFFSKVVEQSWV